MRYQFFAAAAFVIVLNAVGYFYFPWILWSFVIFGPVIVLGLVDAFQARHTIRRNFPLLGRMRYYLEAIRPEVNQYFIESNTDGVPFSREQRSVVYQRAKRELDTLPFGTQQDVYEAGYEWASHSMVPTNIPLEKMRMEVGGPDCSNPYSASLLNVSAMSYGSLSSHAVLALNGAARDGDFAHNTGEGGISDYHVRHGGDLIWQIGTGYFGCRRPDGTFCGDTFAERAASGQVKMIEVKLSQGAKPGHGGILPASKVSPEIARIRGVPLGEDVISPPAHSAFSTPTGLLEFVGLLRELSGGKPVGFKLSVGKRREFIAVCKAMAETGITPDFVTVDGGEGGTGAAPLEFSNHLGSPGVEALIFVHNALVGFGVRDRVRVIATGKITTAFGMLKRLALGADLIYSARAMMMALGCIQALRCNNNSCPTGVATQDPMLVKGLVVADKRRRVATFHNETILSLKHLMEAMGLGGPLDLRPWHIMRRTAPAEVRHYGEIYEFLEPGSLLREPLPRTFARACEAARADSFRHAGSEML